MCDRPITLATGDVIACRSCNSCVSARIHSWVARAMAERSMSAFCYAVTLTYSDASQSSRDGAEAFRYSDVRAWLKRMRAAIFRQTGENRSLRFIACGERGSRRGRVHWHVVLFSAYDLTLLGEWRRNGAVYHGPVVDNRGQNRLDWSLWPHGFVVFQEPDQGGLRYVLKYAVKDQFSARKSADTGRFDVSERFAASYFRMSKAPPIGHEFFWGRVRALVERGQFPVDLRFRVDGLDGYWFPDKMFRFDLLRYLAQSVPVIEAAFGCVPPQLGAFVASLSERDQEVWNELTASPADPAEEEDDLRGRLRTLSARVADRRAHEAFGDLAAAACSLFLSPEELGSLSSAEYARYLAWVRVLVEQARGEGVRTERRDLDLWWRKRREINPFGRYVGFDGLAVRLSRGAFPFQDRRSLGKGKSAGE